VRFTILGSVRAWLDNVELETGPPTQRALLALLLVHAGQPVALSEIVDALWGQDPPRTAVNIVHRHVRRGVRFHLALNPLDWYSGPAQYLPAGWRVSPGHGAAQLDDEWPDGATGEETCDYAVR
jgi:hypothetical protein